MSRQEGGGLLGMLTEGFSFPLIGLVLLIGGLYGFSQYEFAKGGLTPKDFPTDGPDDPPPVDRPKDPPANAASTEAIRANIAAGKFDLALKQARKAGARTLADEALLFQALTRSIQPNAFGKGEPLLTLTTSSGEKLIGHLAGEVNGRLTIDQPDGLQRKVKGNGLKARAELTGEEASAALSRHFKASRQLLGDSPNGLALHRLSFLALAAGQRRHGAALLREALSGTEGGILVDMFGEGDFDRLHSTRRRLAGLPDEPVQVAMHQPQPDTGGSEARDPGGSQTRDPGGSQTRDPDPDPEDEPYEPDPDDEPYEPDPVDDRKPLSSDKRVERRAEYRPQSDPALNDARWSRAGDAYRTGLELYRGSFGVSPTIADAAIRASLKQFQKAQRDLDGLMAEHRDHLVVEQRAQEINQLIVDCMKRQRVEYGRKPSKKKRKKRR